MSAVRSKGTVLKLTLSGLLTPLSQVLSLDFPCGEDETYEADYLDNASPGIPHANTGRVEGGKCSGEIYFDPALAAHQALAALIAAPSTSPVAAAIAFASSPAYVMSFNSVGHKLDGVAALKDGLKGKFDMKVSGVPSFSQGGS